MTNKEKIESIKGEMVDFPWWDPYNEVKEPVKLHISMPTYSNSINILQDSGLRMAIMSSAFRDKLVPEFNFLGSDSLVPRARDKMAASFLESGAEWQLQLDNDIIFPHGVGPELAAFYGNWMDKELFDLFLNEGVFRAALSINAIDEMLRSGIRDGKTIVGGFYFWRGGAHNFNEASSILPTNKEGGFDIEFKLRPDNYIETDKLATGFLLVHRSVYEDIKKTCPELEYDVPNNIPGKSTFAFYNPSITKEERVTPTGVEKFNFYRSEDYAFAYRAKLAGHKPCLNMNILLGHIGTHIYSWFDRPALQKLLLETFEHPMHHIERVKK
jgi:hypothetical protein